MKRFLFLAALLIGFASLAPAQVVVTSTQASTVAPPPPPPPSSTRQAGWLVMPELGGGIASASGKDLGINLGISASCNMDYLINPYIALGGGIGLGRYTRGCFSLPIYAHVRGYFNNKPWSVYYDVKLGGGIALNEVEDDYSYYESYYSDIGDVGHVGYKYTYTASGFYWAVGFGMEYHNFSFGLELSGIPQDHRCFEYRRSDVEHFVDQHSVLAGSYLLKAAYSIPIKRGHIEKNMKKNRTHNN